MKPSVEQIGSLLSLKRHERPPEGYMDDFLREFHMRRREEAMTERGFSAMWSRFTGWLSDPGASKWAYGAGLAYAAILVAFMAGERPIDQEGLNLKPVSHQIVAPAQPAATGVQQLEELDLRPTSEGSTGEQEF
ncbi:hypothetical protein [Haloferula sp.]|uniref:hypothetical protein n=1 Tax=Haloferula sp. TaxID=2497595 RepID=UPI00329BA71A